MGHITQAAWWFSKAIGVAAAEEAAAEEAAEEAEEQDEDEDEDEKYADCWELRWPPPPPGDECGDSVAGR